MSPPGAFLPAVPIINVVDVGAMFAGDGTEPYSALRAAGLARVLGFEPVVEECERLNRRFGPPHRYLPYAIGDGTARRLHVCNESMTSSLYEPNTPLLSAFDGLAAVVRVVRELPIETHRLDDVPEAADADYLKIDVQGAELDVLRGAPRLLARAVVVHTEVEFAPAEDGVLIRPARNQRARFREWIRRTRGSATVKITTDEVMKLTRGEL